MDTSYTKWTQQAVFMYPCVHMYAIIIIKGKAVNLRGSKGGHGECQKEGIWEVMEEGKGKGEMM